MSIFDHIKKKENDKVQAFIDEGQNLLIKNPLQMTLLQAAAKFNNKDALKLLLDRNIDINNLDTSGKSALSYAVNSNNYDIAHLLLSHGADIQFGTINGATIAQFIRQDRVAKKLKKLIEETQQKDQAQNGQQQIQQVGQRPNTNQNQPSLKRQRIDVNVPNLFDSILMGDNQAVLHYLRAQGGDPDLVNQIGTSLLQWACRHGNFCVAKNLVEIGVDYNWVDGNGFSALSYAVFKQNKPLVGMLLRYGADVEQARIAQQSVLDFSRQQGDQEIHLQLLEHLQMNQNLENQLNYMVQQQNAPIQPANQAHLFLKEAAQQPAHAPWRQTQIQNHASLAQNYNGPVQIQNPPTFNSNQLEQLSSFIQNQASGGQIQNGAYQNQAQIQGGQGVG